MPTYDETFFRYVNAGALRSARKVLPLIRRELNVDSVLDVGCGQGAWLSVWRELGVNDVSGVDGPYVDIDNLLIPRDHFHAYDLAGEFDLGRRFDMVQCLEVAEHLPAQASGGLVSSLVRHGDVIVFSAAPKGQGGDHHINEQSYEYWRRLFMAHGYEAFDYLRPKIIDDASIEPWYRYNVFVYASPHGRKRLSERVLHAVVPREKKLTDLSPLPYRLRKLVIRTLPVSVVTAIAKFKETRVAGAAESQRNEVEE